jgi:hypothetical protein
MKFDYYTFNIGAHFACPIIYGDYSGLTDKEIKEIDLFMDNLPVKNGHFDLVEGEDNFSECEVSGLLADCTTLTVNYI